MRKPWTVDEIEFVMVNYADTKTETLAAYLGRTITSVYGLANSRGLKKSDAFMASTESGRLNKERTAGYNTRFKKGQPPPNKGKKQAEFMSAESIERCRSTQFKKGNTPWNLKPNGSKTLRIDKRGRPYYFVKTPNGWVHLHVALWIEAYGLPADNMVIAFKDKNSLNCQLDNLHCISQAQHLDINRRPYLENKKANKKPKTQQKRTTKAKQPVIKISDYQNPKLKSGNHFIQQIGDNWNMLFAIATALTRSNEMANDAMHELIAYGNAEMCSADQLKDQLKKICSRENQRKYRHVDFEKVGFYMGYSEDWEEAI